MRDVQAKRLDVPDLSERLEVLVFARCGVHKIAVPSEPLSDLAADAAACARSRMALEIVCWVGSALANAGVTSTAHNVVASNRIADLAIARHGRLSIYQHRRCERGDPDRLLHEDGVSLHECNRTAT